MSVNDVPQASSLSWLWESSHQSVFSAGFCPFRRSCVSPVQQLHKFLVFALDRGNGFPLSRSSASGAIVQLKPVLVSSWKCLPCQSSLAVALWHNNLPSVILSRRHIPQIWARSYKRLVCGSRRAVGGVNTFSTYLGSCQLVPPSLLFDFRVVIQL